MRRPARTIHKYLSLAAVVLWLVQIATGTALVFMRDLDDLALDASGRPVSAAAIDRGVNKALVGTPGGVVTRVQASGGTVGQFDVIIAHPSGTTAVRVDGADGSLLRQRQWQEPWRSIGVPRLVLLVHQELLGGTAGHWLMGISGLLLAANLMLALISGWPRRNFWRRTLIPRGVPPGGPAAAYSWHRAMGLWAAAPVLLLAVSGSLLVWIVPIKQAIGAIPAAPLAPPHSGAPVSLALAIERASSVVRPGATLAVIDLPSLNSPAYRLRLLLPGEPQRTFGTTTVFVAAADGTVLRVIDALEQPLSHQVVAWLYPIHTGEILGLPGRIAVMASGAAMLTLMTLGVTLWWRRRRHLRATDRRKAGLRAERASV